MSEAPQSLLDEALRLHDTGDWTAAEGLYRKVLEQDPGQFVAIHQLGVIRNQRGDYEGAVQAFSEALPRFPKSALLHFNLGNAYAHLARYDEAYSHYQYSLVLNSQNPQALLNAAVALRNLGRQDEALHRLEKLLGRQELLAEALLNKGIVLLDLYRYEEARVTFDHLLRLEPLNLGALMNRGNALVGLGRAEEALASFEAALALDPDAVEGRVNRGNAFLDLERFEEALGDYDRALNAQPRLAAAWNNRSVALRGLHRNLEALESCQRALEIDPHNADALLNQGTALYFLARQEEAIACFDQALALRPDFAQAHSNKIFVLDYLPEPGFQEHQQVRKAFYLEQAKGLGPLDSDFTQHRDPNRTLVLGYVSADFKQHSAATCFGPVLKHHDKSRFRVVCYSGVVHEDGKTREFRALADVWRSTVGVSDEALARQIRGDQVDILIDLSGHSKDSRLLVFARKPAPVQVSAWGNGGGTGLPMMDYHFTDPVFTPEWARPLYAETSYDLPCCLTYEPPTLLPPVRELPAAAKGFVTFGSLNRFNKIRPAILELWADILRAVPRSHLLLKCAGLEEAATQDRVRGVFTRKGIEAARIDIRGTTSQQEHLQTYGDIDLVLDTFPQNGGVTTWESLWMGVPVLAILGNKPPSRLSGAILHALGLGEWVGDTEAEYAALAVAKAADLESLAAFRRTIRARILASPAGDSERYTRAVEEGYRAMWKRWVGEGCHV